MLFSEMNRGRLDDSSGTTLSITNILGNDMASQSVGRIVFVGNFSGNGSGQTSLSAIARDPRKYANNIYSLLV